MEEPQKDSPKPTPADDTQATGTPGTPPQQEVTVDFGGQDSTQPSSADPAGTGTDADDNRSGTDTDVGPELASLAPDTPSSDISAANTPDTSSSSAETDPLFGNTGERDTVTSPGASDQVAFNEPATPVPPAPSAFPPQGPGNIPGADDPQPPIEPAAVQQPNSDVPGVAPTAAHPSDKKTMLILVGVAVVLIAAIAVLFFK